jgi:response regulator of citrate/malate metabolism
MGGHQCFVVYDRKRLERITAFDKVDENEPAVHELPFKEISEKSGVSINKIYQLKCLMDLYKKDTFTSLELAQEFGNSLRSMNRMIEKLEQAGYIEVVGSKIIGQAGRPSRILKVGI